MKKLFILTFVASLGIQAATLNEADKVSVPILTSPLPQLVENPTLQRDLNTKLNASIRKNFSTGNYSEISTDIKSILQNPNIQSTNNVYNKSISYLLAMNCDIEEPLALEDGGSPNVVFNLILPDDSSIEVNNSLYDWLDRNSDMPGDSLTEYVARFTKSILKLRSWNERKSETNEARNTRESQEIPQAVDEIWALAHLHNFHPAQFYLARRFEDEDVYYSKFWCCKRSGQLSSALYFYDMAGKQIDAHLEAKEHSVAIKTELDQYYLSISDGIVATLTSASASLSGFASSSYCTNLYESTCNTASTTLIAITASIPPVWTVLKGYGLNLFQFLVRPAVGNTPKKEQFLAMAKNTPTGATEDAIK